MAETHPLAGKEIGESYRRLCAGIIRGLALLGLSAHFVPINDIIVADKKISGNAQTRRKGCVLQHGTLILDLDVDLMFRLLRVPPEKTKDRIIADVKSRVIGLNPVLGRELSFAEAAAALAEGFREALSLDFGAPENSRGPLPEEEERARRLGAEKFSSREWLYRR
jgi:lipoate-protein ligase A